MCIVRCPRCRDEVTVPARATSRALVRCPLCLEQYLLAEALPGRHRRLSSSAARSSTRRLRFSAEPGIEYTVAAGGLDSAAFDARAPAAAAVMAPRPILRTSPVRAAKNKAA
jgi:hypothetical protein